MTDHITDELTSDMAIAAALRTFLTSPPIISMIQACVTEATTAEVQRLMASSLILDNVTAALRSPSSTAQLRLSDALGALIRADIEESTRYLLNEDSARDFIRDELESEPRYFTRAVESAVEASIDTDEIASNAKDRVLEDLDLDDLNIEDKINEVLDNRGGRDTDLDDEDIDRIATRVCKVIRLEPQNKSFM